LIAVTESSGAWLTLLLTAAPFYLTYKMYRAGRESEARQGAILEAAHDAIITMDQKTEHPRVQSRRGTDVRAAADRYPRPQTSTCSSRLMIRQAQLDTLTSTWRRGAAAVARRLELDRGSPPMARSSRSN